MALRLNLGAEPNSGPAPIQAGLFPLCPCPNPPRPHALHRWPSANIRAHVSVRKGAIRSMNLASPGREPVTYTAWGHFELVLGGHGASHYSLYDPLV